MNQAIKAIPRAIPVIFLASCASIMVKDTSTINVATIPAGAAFTTNVAGIAGTTPALVALPNGVEVTFTFTADGYAPLTAKSKPVQSMWVVGNAVFGIVGGVAASIADAGNGSTKVHKADIRATMLRLDADGVPIPLVEDAAPEMDAPLPAHMHRGTRVGVKR